MCLILFLPLLSAVLITLVLKRAAGTCGKLAIAAAVASFGFGVLVFAFESQWHGGVLLSVPWIELPGLSVGFGFLVDHLSVLMLLVVGAVGSAIHIYSYEYMRGDAGFSRYFAGLGLFMFSMYGIVVSGNLIQLFIFWELVGLSSYVLIGFWYERGAAADAAKKALITNRIGDFGFLVGILMLWGLTGTVDYDGIKNALSENPGVLGGLSTLTGLLIFCGAVGKSAQFPLHVWLPDAMEGPTPVSALIHAATMVAAGVYMLCRLSFVFLATPAWPEALSWLSAVTAPLVIAWVGGVTALLAALIATQQDDIKRILAYSTLSQLGYMVMAVGMIAPIAAMYHLTMHAFFKALLFMGAGSVIHAIAREQDIWKMGGLRKRMPLTFLVFLAATLALCGVPPFSGFYSKDEILLVAYGQSPGLFVLGMFVAFLTAFYMFRLIMVVFYGKARSAVVDKAHEGSITMTWPMVFLAVLSVVGGLIGVKHYLGAELAHGSVGESQWYLAVFAPFVHAPFIALIGLAAVVLGYISARTMYLGAASDPFPAGRALLARVLRRKLYVDEVYDRLNAVTQEAAAVFADWFDRWIIAGVCVRGAHGTTELTGRMLRLMQSGSLRAYSFWFGFGLVIVILISKSL